VLRVKSVLLTALFAHSALAIASAPPSEAARQTAQYALATYSTDIVTTLEKMVSFNTVANPDVPFERNAQQLGFKQLLKDEAQRLGFDYTDYGYIVVLGLGSGSERVGIVTHGDIQPSDPSKWAKSPFTLDQTSEPGRLIGRGTEDDKGPVATALYAMKSIKDKQIVLGKRIELYVYLAEESNWDHLTAFLKDHVPPQLSITLDAEYPVVTAEKGGGTLSLTFGAAPAKVSPRTPELSAFTGGFFGSQIPEDASATIEHASAALEKQVRQRANAQKGMHYKFARKGSELVVTARGVSAHSSKPEAGINAISMLADALAVRSWPANKAGSLVNFLNEMVGTSLYAEKFGKLAYSDSFMGPMSFAPTVIKQTPDGIELDINMRRPRGKTEEQVTADINDALAGWQSRHGPLAKIGIKPGTPWVQQGAPQVDTLLSVFSHYTGIADAKPVAIGGGTNSRMFPNAVSFGPGMPGEVYTGHSEHEFITRAQLLLNLQMYTAVLVELAKAP
jgi:dipeptidase D